MQMKVNISMEILQWVSEQISIENIPEPVKEYVTSWISGKKEPTFNQVEKVSKVTHIPLGYFFLKKPPIEDTSFVNYRTIDSLDTESPSRELIDIMHEMENIQGWVREHLMAEEFRCDFVGCIKNSDIFAFSNEVRKILNLELDWYRNVKNTETGFNLIRRSLSEAGVIVMMNGTVGNNTHRALDIEEFRAFALVDEIAPLIFINSKDSINGRLFSLLHEFAHICMGENSLYNDRYSFNTNIVKTTETICNAVAAEILVPQQQFIAEWKNSTNHPEPIELVNSLARKFKCGTTVIARRAYDNNFISYSLYQEIAQKAVSSYNEWQKLKKEKGNEGGDYYKLVASRIDNRFFNMLVNSVREGKTLYTDAFKLTNLNRSSFASLVDRMGGGGN